jgi:MarR family transcriptional regulator for hemolysin
MLQFQTPIGLLLFRISKAVSRAFEARLGESGGSLPTWTVLLTLVRGGHASQSEVAEEIGIRGPTLSHHLNAMEAAGLITRIRRNEDRRTHEVALTGAGRARFHQLRQAAAEHDRQLRSVLSAEELEVLHRLLTRLGSVVGENAKREVVDA